MKTISLLSASPPVRRDARRVPLTITAHAYLHPVGAGNASSLSLNIAENGERVAARFYDLSSAAVQSHRGQDTSDTSTLGNEQAIALHAKKKEMKKSQPNSFFSGYHYAGSAVYFYSGRQACKHGGAQRPILQQVV